MAFTTLTDGAITSEVLYAVIAELKTAINERHAFFSSTPVAWTASLYRDDAGKDLYKMQRWISDHCGSFVKTGSDFTTYGATHEYQTTVTESLSRPVLLTEVGWGTDWIENDPYSDYSAFESRWFVDDPRMWQQIQAALIPLVTLKSSILNAHSAEATYKATDATDTPTTQTLAWNSMLAHSTGTLSVPTAGMGVSRRDSSYPYYYWAYGYPHSQFDVDTNLHPAALDALPILRLKNTYWQRRGDADLSAPQVFTDNFGRTFEVNNGTTAGTLKIKVEDGSEDPQYFDNLPTDVGSSDSELFQPTHTPASTLTIADVIASGLTLDVTIPASPPWTGLSPTVGGAVYLDIWTWLNGITSLAAITAHDISGLLTYG